MVGLFVRKTIISFLLVFFLIIAYFWWVLNGKGLVPAKYIFLLNKTAFVMVVLAIFYWLQRLISTLFDWYRDSVVLKTKTQLDDNFIPLFSRAASLILWSICLVILLSHFGININAILATLGVGSLAIALAAQDTIANLIAGFLIMIDRPFVVGDTIKLPNGLKAKVIEVGIRRSKFLGEDKGLIIVPNVDLSKNTIINYSNKTD